MDSRCFVPLFVIVISGLGSTYVSGAFRSAAMEEQKDASDVTWAHAVNSRDELEKALESTVDFLEADIILGHIKGSEDDPPIPIMAHPPKKTSDISLADWLSTVAVRGTEKGLKLDFKSIEVVEPSLITLQKYSTKLNSSVWLNADVLPGPVNSPTHPVNIQKFLAKCHQYFPTATLSIGWTTYWFPTITTPETWHYQWQHVRKMVDVIRCSGYENNYPQFTFPVRAIFASRSIKRLQWLLSAVPSSTLTIWSNKFDPLEVQDLLRIRSSFPKHRVYYDVPDSIYEKFQENKDSVSVPNFDLVNTNDQWMTLTRGHGESCAALTYVENNTVVFGKSLTTAVLQKSLIQLGETPSLKISGRIQFFNVSGEAASYTAEGMQELRFVLADISLFTKNMSHDSGNEVDLTTSDTEILWSAIDTSVIFTFQHHYAEDETTCRAFKLDISADKSFEVWTVPCDTLLEDGSFEEIAKSGVPEISSRKRLVLPKGPLMFGLVSKGEEYVVVHDLEISGSKETFTSGSTPSVTTLLGSFATFLYICFILFMLL